MSERSDFGRDAEKRAELWFLERTQSRLIARNYRCRWGEIDLIFEESQPLPGEVDLVFIEVRACSTKNWLKGPETLGWKKQQCLRRTAYHFLSRYPRESTTVRMDLLSWDGVRWSHLPNLWIF